MEINILCVGDVVGGVGLSILNKKLRSIKKLKGVDFTVVNGENASGIGITPDQAEEIFAAGADVITLGNHTWGRGEIKNYLDDCGYILRPANYAPQVPGRGWGVFPCRGGDICVMNLIGRCDMHFGPDNPFFAADRIIGECGCKMIVADMHAEATSEKLAMGHYLDGRASVVFGTHTHVQTSDACVMEKGTGYITDLGMTGARDSILGIKKELSISRFLGNPPQRYVQAEGPGKIECALFTVESTTGRCVAAETMRVEE